jgi:hypothetical protein
MWFGASCTISNVALIPAATIAMPPFVVIWGAFISAGPPMAEAYFASNVAAGGSATVACCAPALAATSAAAATVKRRPYLRIMIFLIEKCGVKTTGIVVGY